MIDFRLENNKATCFVHIKDQTLNVDHFNKEDTGEFVVIDVWDSKKNQWVKVFFSDEALDSLLEKMNVISALRFKNGGSRKET
jgi:hypothetical protein